MSFIKNIFLMSNALTNRRDKSIFSRGAMFFSSGVAAILFTSFNIAFILYLYKFIFKLFIKDYDKYTYIFIIIIITISFKAIVISISYTLNYNKNKSFKKYFFELFTKSLKIYFYIVVFVSILLIIFYISVFFLNNAEFKENIAALMQYYFLDNMVLGASGISTASSSLSIKSILFMNNEDNTRFGGSNNDNDSDKGIKKRKRGLREDSDTNNISRAAKRIKQFHKVPAPGAPSVSATSPALASAPTPTPTPISTIVPSSYYYTSQVPGNSLVQPSINRVPTIYNTLPIAQNPLWIAQNSLPVVQDSLPMVQNPSIFSFPVVEDPSIFSFPVVDSNASSLIGTQNYNDFLDINSVYPLPLDFNFYTNTGLHNPVPQYNDNMEYYNPLSYNNLSLSFTEPHITMPSQSLTSSLVPLQSLPSVPLVPSQSLPSVPLVPSQQLALPMQSPLATETIPSVSKTYCSRIKKFQGQWNEAFSAKEDELLRNIGDKKGTITRPSVIESKSRLHADKVINQLEKDDRKENPRPFAWRRTREEN